VRQESAKAKDAECTKKCLDGGQPAVLVVDGKDGAIVSIVNPEKIKGHEGHHVTVTGKLDGDKLTVASVKMVEEKKRQDVIVVRSRVAVGTSKSG